ncbi:MAG: hypothetical protein P4M11_01180 [Candidatus Pacebacteria bacterium]|nr:hypothetical protein [Candidatus Paceibacterota bacterium]
MHRLVSGNVRGNFSLLFDTVEKIQASKGNFDALLCVGETLSADNVPPPTLHSA